MTRTLLYVDPIYSYLALYFSVEHITVIVASYNNDLASKLHIPFLTLSHSDSNLQALEVETLDSQTL